MVQCDYCGKDTYLPFRCKYCGDYFCSEHRLPESHRCKGEYQYSRSTSGYTNFTPTGTTYNPRQRSRSRYYFSKKELRDLGIGLVVILAIPLMSLWGYFRISPFIVLGAVLIFGLGFILHEFAHKFMAQRLGYWAEFRINQQGLMLTLLSFFSPFKIIAPGAVMINGGLNWDDYGKISIAGPVTNIGLGVLFFFMMIMSGSFVSYTLASIGMNINASLALFNLIPFGVLDGRKIYSWSKVAWGVTVAAALIIYMLSNFRF